MSRRYLNIWDMVWRHAKPPCAERDQLDQASPGRPSQACCTRCGRVTARRDPDRHPWCGGAC